MLETELINECKKYNPIAQRIVYKTYYNVFLKLSVRYTGNTDDAKDIVQDAFLKIFSNITKFKSEGSFEGWMKRIVINDSITFIKKKAKFNFTSISGQETALETNDYHTHQSEEKTNEPLFSEEELLKAIHSLSDDQRIIFNLICIEEYSHREAAAILNITEENSRARLMKARQRLKKILDAKTIRY